MINVIHAAKIKAVVIAHLQSLSLCDSVINQGILLILTAPCLIRRNADVLQDVMFCLNLINFLANEVRLELPGAPASSDSWPAVSSQGKTEPVSLFNGPAPFNGSIQHQVFKALGMFEPGNVYAALMKQIVIQLFNMLLNFREIHPCIGENSAINGHIFFDHKNHGGSAIFPSGHGNDMIVTVLSRPTVIFLFNFFLYHAVFSSVPFPACPLPSFNVHFSGKAKNLPNVAICLSVREI